MNKQLIGLVAGMATLLGALVYKLGKNAGRKEQEAQELWIPVRHGQRTTEVTSIQGRMVYYVDVADTPARETEEILKNMRASFRRLNPRF